MLKSCLIRMVVFISGSSLVVFLLTACISIDKKFGYFPSLNAVNELKVGSFNKDQVKALIGPAAITEDDSWIYIGSDVSTIAFLSPKVVQRDILFLQFNDRDKLAAKDVLTIADGKIFDISTSKEITDPRKRSTLRRLFGNLTKFSAESFIAQN